MSVAKLIPVATALLALVCGCAVHPPPAGAPGAPLSARPAVTTPIPLPTITPAAPASSAAPRATATVTPVRTPTATSTQATSGAVNCAKVKCVALTLDDGPIAQTNAVLDVLKRKHVHATFFVLGEQAKAHPSVIRRIVTEGHALGSHSWDHPQFHKINKAAIRSQLTRTNAVLKKITGRNPKLMRPPYGQFDARVRDVAKSLGQAIIVWSVDPLDWKDHNTGRVVKRVLKAARGGSIILTHDIQATTRKAYGTIIDKLRKKGYTFVTVPVLFGGKTTPGRVYFSR